MKKDVPLKLQCIGNIKPNETTFILLELLGNCSEVEKGQEDVLEKLHLIASSGEDVMTDPKANNKKSLHTMSFKMRLQKLFHKV